MAAEITIRSLPDAPEIRAALSEMLIEAVALGSSVSFLHPLAPEAAEAFWTSSFAAVGRGERVLLGAFDGQALVATVTLRLDCAQNQPHRAEVAKLITRPSHRGRGLATALMHAAEAEAAARGRSLLVLDTAEDGGAAPLYEALGYRAAGVIPDYSFKPHGGLSATIIYWKRLEPPVTAKR